LLLATIQFDQQRIRAGESFILGASKYMEGHFKPDYRQEQNCTSEKKN